MASDRGVGLQAGYQAAWQDGFWVCDQFHAFQDLFNRCHQLERQAYAALGKEIKQRRHSPTPKAKPICTSVLSTMNKPVKL